MANRGRKPHKEFPYAKGCINRQETTEKQFRNRVVIKPSDLCLAQCATSLMVLSQSELFLSFFLHQFNILSDNITELDIKDGLMACKNLVGPVKKINMNK